MKKIILIVIVLFVSIEFQAQSDKNFRKIDRYALKAPKKINTSIVKLSEYLTDPYEDDLEKVRSIFTWLIYNIDYDNTAYNDGNKRINQSNEDVLTRKKAVCFGYATLFKALCEAANIEAEVVSGFSKQTLGSATKLGENNHAWNAVKINGKWQLLDATWTSGLKTTTDDFMKTFDVTYFLPSPELFICNHLPADPMWQLLDGIVTPAIFIKNHLTIRNHLETTKNRIDYTDTLIEYEKLEGLERRLASEERAFRFYPSTQMAKEYGHTLMDYQGELADIAEMLQGSSFLDSLIDIQEEMILLCEKAARITELFPNQLESCAYNRMNYAVALSQKVDSVDSEERTRLLQVMKVQALEAKKTLEQLPMNFMIKGALGNCQQILEYLKQ
jgi:hypothetical protein